MKGRLAISVLVLVAGCSRDVDEHTFQRKVEQFYGEANPGFSVIRREDHKSTLARGDQTVALDTGALFAEYKISGKSGSAYLDLLADRFDKEAKARRRTLEQAKHEVVPILKSVSWIRVQDVGAIGPPSQQEQLRPWRQELNKELFVVLGVPEQLLGYRYVSIHDVKSSTVSEETWLKRAIQNLADKSKDAKATDLEGNDKRLLVHEFAEAEGIGGLILDPGFRMRMLTLFNKEELGAAVPTRDRLIVFDPSEFVATKPVRARTHQLYDTQNHPGFRGLLRFDKDVIAILESGKPEAPGVAGASGAAAPAAAPK